MDTVQLSQMRVMHAYICACGGQRAPWVLLLRRLHTSVIETWSLSWPLSSDLLSSIGIKSGPPCLSVFLFFSHTGYKDQTQVLMVARSHACTLLTELSHT